MKTANSNKTKNLTKAMPLIGWYIIRYNIMMRRTLITLLLISIIFKHTRLKNGCFYK